MDIQRIINIKPIYYLTSKSLPLRKFWLWLHIWQHNHKKTALVDEKLVEKYGMKQIRKMIRKHKGKEPLMIDSFEVKFI
jgi:hypothetical protein